MCSDGSVLIIFSTQILNKINSTLAQSPDHKFALLGYSQGGAATTDALIRITAVKDEAAFAAVKVVLIVGNKRHKAGLRSNIDSDGGNTTVNGDGVFAAQGYIPAEWDNSGKTLDICAPGDSVCDSQTLVRDFFAHIS